VMRLTLVLAIAPGLFAQSPQVAHCIDLRHHGDPQSRACFERLSHSADLATRAEGLWGIGDYYNANEAFRAAYKADTAKKNIDVRLRWGLFYLDRYQPVDAKDLIQEALAIDPNNAHAMLALARVAAESFEGAAADLAEKALKADPKLYQAHELLARMALEDDEPAKADEEAHKALDISPEALDAMAVLASIDLLAHKPSTPWLDRALKINPAYGETYAIVGHFFIIKMRYTAGIAAYRKAIAIDPNLQSVRSELGVNLMRVGQEEEAHRMLEEAYNAGYKSPETVNSLRLLDTLAKFKTFKTPTTILRLDPKEADLLRPYMQAELDRVIAAYEKKYKMKLKGPVELEVYPNHDDFAAHTTAMPGLGALGATFVYSPSEGTWASSIAIDSPSARKPGTFHWASTLWHEMSHVFVLQATSDFSEGSPDPRVPRWFTEGLAVYEESAVSPDWGDRMDTEDIMAIKNKKLLPIADLDRGFIHPTYPTQVVVSYFQGGKICSFIVEKWGYDKILDMIRDYSGSTTTAAVIEKEFKIKPEEFDRQFFAWLDAQTKKTVDGFDDWRKGLLAVAESAKAKQLDDVIAQGHKIRDIYPDYVEPGSVYEFLADAYLAKNDKAAAIAELKRYNTIGGRDPATIKKLASLEAEQGDKRAAAATLERLTYIYLKDEDLHKRLGDLWFDLGNATGAIREYQAVVDGGAIDMAGAHYQLAKALNAAHRTDEARNEVLSSLEVAPGYRPAQKLLLELNVKQ